MNYQKVTAYSALFVAVTWACILSFALASILWEAVTREKENESYEIRRTHLQQHVDEQEQFERMIELLEEVSAKLDAQ